MLFCLLLSAAAAAAQTAAGAVEGTLVNSATGLGIAGIPVDLIWSGDLAYSTTTDARGGFLFDHVAEGAYTLRCAEPDYIRGPDGQRPFRVTAGNPVKLEVRLMPLARIGGRVVDGRGDPVPNAQLQLLGTGAVLGAQTDAKGKFELRPFPGAFTLSVVPPPGLKPPDPEPESDGVLSWTRTFYPGVSVPEAASKIIVRPGGEISDIELKLRAAAAHALRGVLLNADGTPASKAAIALGDDAAMPSLHAESKSDGAFEFPAVADGEWSISAEVESGGVKLRAQEWMQMAGHDREGLKLRLSPPFALRGKVVMETAGGVPAPKPQPVGLIPHVNRIRQETGLVIGGPHGTPDADGNFSVPNVYPGVYEIGPSDPPPGFYLDAIRVGDAPSTQEVEISSSAVFLTVVYKTNGGAVRGTVETCASGGVFLIPQDPALRWGEFVRQAPCDSHNRYEIAAARPGDYYLLAFAGSGFRPFLAPRLDDGLFNQAARVTVRAGEASSADLRAIAQPAQ